MNHDGHNRDGTNLASNLILFHVMSLRSEIDRSADSLNKHNLKPRNSSRQ